jgi:hypothetical protein
MTMLRFSHLMILNGEQVKDNKMNAEIILEIYMFFFYSQQQTQYHSIFGGLQSSYCLTASLLLEARARDHIATILMRMTGLIWDTLHLDAAQLLCWSRGKCLQTTNQTA